MLIIFTSYFKIFVYNLHLKFINISTKEKNLFNFNLGSDNPKDLMNKENNNWKQGFMFSSPLLLHQLDTFKNIDNFLFINSLISLMVLMVISKMSKQKSSSFSWCTTISNSNTWWNTSWHFYIIKNKGLLSYYSTIETTWFFINKRRNYISSPNWTIFVSLDA